MDNLIEPKPGARERGPWGPLATIGFSFAIAVAVVLTQLVAAIPYVLVRSMGRSRGTIRAVAMSLQSDGLFLALAEVCSAAVGVGLILLLAWLRKGPGIRRYLALTKVSRSALLKWLLLTVVLGIVLDGAARLAGYTSIPEWMEAIYLSAGSLPLLVFALIVVAPIFEELSFRGFLFEGLRRSWLGDSGTILVTSLVWAVIHTQYQLVYVLQIFALGLLLGAARLRTGSIVTPIAMHALFSAIAIVQVVVELG